MQVPFLPFQVLWEKGVGVGISQGAQSMDLRYDARSADAYHTRFNLAILGLDIIPSRHSILPPTSFPVHIQMIPAYVLI